MTTRSAVLAATLLFASPVVALGQNIRTDLCMTDGVVRASAVSGNLLYIAGDFTYVGPRTGPGVSIDATTGEVAALPRITGNTGPAVTAVIPDGGGGWYIGGQFTQVNGMPRANVAHILADNSVASWNPGCDGQVYVLLMSGSTVYVGGSFTTFGGQARANLAAFDATTGAVTSWNPGATGFSVLALAAIGTTIYVGGDFNSIGGQARTKIAAVDAVTGAVSAWNPSPSGPGGGPWYVRCLAASGSVVYAGGGFTSIGFQFRHGLAALDASTGAATAWNPDPSNGADVFALAVNGSTVYVGGAFITMGGQPRNGLAAVDAVTGNATAWNPNPTGGRAASFAFNGSTVYVGGGFLSIGGQSRSYIAALDAVSGNATAWNPTTNSDVSVVATDGPHVFAGGYFRMAGGKPRSRAAALDLTTGLPTPWDPSIGGSSPYVYAMAVNGSTVYLGGTFTVIGGQTRNYVGAVNATTGAVTGWNPNPNLFVYALATSGSNVYVGGNQFTTIGGQPRSWLAAVDATTGNATAWNPAANGIVQTLAISGSTIYAGGRFTSMGGQSRNNIAALDATTANATSWNPTAGSDVYALVVDGSTIYVGGAFPFIGAASRSYIAALDATTGNATAWNPGSNREVHALAFNGAVVYAGGYFQNIGGLPRNCLAALDKSTGTATSWNPGPNGFQPVVLTLAQSGSTLYLGGDFSSVGNGAFDIRYVAGVEGTTVDVPGGATRSGPLSLTGRPNPFGSSTEIQFELPRAEEVSVRVFDIAGREVARLADRKHLEAGFHRLPFDARGLSAGVYFCRLSIGESSGETRLVKIP